MPNRITENKDRVEASFVFSLWNDPKSYRTFRNKIDDTSKFFTSSAAQFYYTLGLEMFQKGYSEFDKVSVETYVSSTPSIRNEYDRLGGYSTYSDIKSGVKKENSDGFYNDILKMNCLKDLHDKGFSIIADWDKLRRMTLDQIKRYYTYQLNNVMLDKTSGVEIETMEITDDDMGYFIEGLGMGYSIHHTSPLLNHSTLGLHEGVTIIGGGSGTGKSSFISGVLLRSWIKDKIPACIIANEEDSRKWKTVLISMVAYEMFGNKALTRRRLKMGNFTKAEREMLETVRDKINKDYGKTIQFVKLYGYSPEEVELVIDMMSARGIKAFVYDTFKASDDANARDEMKETSKVLFQCADRNGAMLVLTMQLALYMSNIRHLQMDNISSSKQTVEVAGEVFLMRGLWEDEVTGGKHDVKAYRYATHPKTGEYLKGIDGKPIKDFIKIEEGEHSDYMLLFVAKTRNDKRDKIILYKVNGDYSIWEEIGYCTVGFANRGGDRR